MAAGSAAGLTKTLHGVSEQVATPPEETKHVLPPGRGAAGGMIGGLASDLAT